MLCSTTSINRRRAMPIRPLWRRAVVPAALAVLLLTSCAGSSSPSTIERSKRPYEPRIRPADLGGVVVNTEGSWEAGVDGAKAGIIMKARPRFGVAYRQEYYRGHAEDSRRC